MRLTPWSVTVCVAVLVSFVFARIHKLKISNDTRRFIEVSDFGYVQNSTLEIRISNISLSVDPTQLSTEIPIGFSLSKGDEVAEFLKTHPGVCLLDSSKRSSFQTSSVFLLLDFSSQRISIIRDGDDVELLVVCAEPRCGSAGTDTRSRARPKRRIVSSDAKPYTRGEIPTPTDEGFGRRRVLNDEDEKNVEQDLVFDKTNVNQLDSEPPLPVVDEYPKPVVTHKEPPIPVVDEYPKPALNDKEQPLPVDEYPNPKSVLNPNTNDAEETSPPSTVAPAVQKDSGAIQSFLPLTRQSDGSYSATIFIAFRRRHEAGMYSLVFHNCYNYRSRSRRNQMIAVDAVLDIVEFNGNTYLSGGDAPKPMLYIVLSVVFACTGFVWLSILKFARGVVHKIHWIMVAVIFFKAGSLFFHACNVYFIGINGHQRDIWAGLFYTMHIIKGALLFTTVILIGTGWTLFKHFLTQRDKKIFMIIIPLQVLDNIALIVVEESELGMQFFRFWFQVFVFVDLVCCAAIILPIVWSIRHLQDASETDGKAASNLMKLKLFRHFYISVICYIYLTRILKYLIAFTVPYNFSWLIVLVEEIGTYVFFVLTGYQFRPVIDNPYLKLAQSDDEDEDIALTESGAMEGVVRVNFRTGRRQEAQGVQNGLED